MGDGNVTNTVVATGECISGCDYSTSTDSATVVQVQGIFKTPDLQTAPIGQEVTFDTYVSYWGVGHSYQNVVITDTLPVGLDYVTSTYSDDWPGADPTPSVLGQTITWNLGNFTGRNIVHITLTARIQDILSNFDGVVRTNSVRTTGSEDGSPFDLSDTADVRIVEPHLTIDKAGSRTEGLPGDVVHYTITVHNDGTSNAYDVNIEDSLPAGLILNPLSVTSTPSANSTTIVGNIITWTYNTIPVGGTSILEYDEIIPPEGGTFTDTSTITQYSSLQGDSPDERDYPPVSDDWTVTAPGTDIKKITLNTQANVPSPGGIVYYTMTVTNTGSMPLNPVKLIDILPDGLTYRPGSSNVDGQSYEPNTIVNNFDGTQILTWSNIWLHTGDMNPDDTIVILFEATVDPNRIGTFVNRAIVIGTSRIGDVSDEDTSTVGVLMPAIDVIKTASPSRAKPNEKVTFTLIVTNTGQVPLNPVTVEDFLPSELVYQTGSASPPPTSIDPAPGGILLRWNLSLIVGGSTSITFNVKTTILGDFINEVKATGTPPNGSNVTDNDAAVVSVRIEHPKPPTESLKPLALNWLLDCKLCNMAPIEARLAKLGVEFKAKACCGNLTNAAERLFQLIREKGLDKTKPEEYKSALELYEQAKNCCDLAQKYFDVGNYMASINFSVKRCSLYKELFEILLKMLGA